MRSRDAKSVAVAVASSAIATIVLGAHRLPAAEPEQATGRGELHDVCELLRDAVDRRQVAGAVALVIADGATVFDDAVGWRDVRLQEPMTRDALFRIASMTKPITSVAILMLHEQGKLDLHAPLSTYLPEFAAPTVANDSTDGAARPAKREMTIHDLLTHTSGLTYRFLGVQPQADLYRAAGVSDGLIESPFPLSENVRRLAGCPLACDPGEAWGYGLSTDVLGRVVEAASGQPLDEFLAAGIFEPLGMVDTSFVVPEAKASRLATLYSPSPQGGLEAVSDGKQSRGGLDFSATFQRAGTSPYRSGGAGLVSTARDYARFLSMLLAGGRLGDVRILRPETVAMMTSNQIGKLNVAFPIHGDKFGYGVGVHVDSAERHGAARGAYSWGGAFHTYFWVDPQNKVVGVLMTQLFPFDHFTLWADFQSRTYEALDARDQRPAAQPQPGDTYREYWVHCGGPSNWRVTDPQATAPGAQEFLPNPVQTIVIDDLRDATRAEAVLDRWGGHAKTENKRLRFNGKAWLQVPEIATTPQRPELYYSQDNPTFEIPIDHLREGDNTFEGACSGMDGFGWGQWGVNALCVRVYYDPQKKQGPTAHIASPAPASVIRDNPHVVVEADSPQGVARVEVLARYWGFDENGDGVFDDWHHGYFNESREAPPRLSGHVGTAVEAPFDVEWDTRWIPDQDDRPAALVARVQDSSGLWSVTGVVDGLQFKRRSGRVAMYLPDEISPAFGVRNGQQKSCTITLPQDAPLAEAEAAIMPLRTWHGFDGHHQPLALNGYSFPIAGKNHYYDLDLHAIPVDTLRRGANRLQIESQTEHHMLEVLWPGPVLIVRYRQ